MKHFIAIIAAGLDAVRIAFSKSKIEKTAAAVVAGVVGVGLLASPFLLRADDEEEKTNDAPYVSCLWIANSGSIGFEVDFVVSFSSDSDESLSGFELHQDGKGIVDQERWVKHATLRSAYCDWFSVPGFDGSTSTAPIGSPAFEFTIKGLKFEGLFPYGGPHVDVVHSVASSVTVQLYVDVNCEGALESMSAYAYDSDGDSYRIYVYYSAGGWEGDFDDFEF